ncbi:hypothetical protein HW509_11285 [Asaia spathodeae]
MTVIAAWAGLACNNRPASPPQRPAVIRRIACPLIGRCAVFDALAVANVIMPSPMPIRAI